MSSSEARPRTTGTTQRAMLGPRSVSDASDARRKASTAIPTPRSMSPAGETPRSGYPNLMLAMRTTTTWPAQPHVPRKRARSPQKKHLPRSRVCLVNCKYPLLHDMCKRLGVLSRREDGDWCLFWTDTSVAIERVMRLKKTQRINHFVGNARDLPQKSPGAELGPTHDQASGHLQLRTAKLRPSGRAGGVHGRL